MNESIKCDNCFEEINPEEDYHRYGRTELLCEDCSDGEWDNAPRLFVYGHPTHDEGDKFFWSDQFGFANEYLEELFGDQEQTLPVSGFEYVKTDAWRGYWNPQIREEFISFDGWSTGYADESLQHKNILHELLDDLAEHHVSLYCPIWVIIAPTSNVFSQSTDIVIKKAHLDYFEDFLFDNYSVTLDELKQSLK